VKNGTERDSQPFQDPNQKPPKAKKFHSGKQQPFIRQYLGVSLGHGLWLFRLVTVVAS
jgi:hypothetical protein